MRFKIRFYNSVFKKWMDWKNIYNKIIIGSKKDLKEGFEDTYSYQIYELKYKFVNIK